MNVSVTFKKIDSSKSLKSYVQKKLERLGRMLDRPADVHVVLSVEKIRHIAEATLDCDKLKIHAKEESERLYSSIDALADNLKLQIKKNKEKQRRHLAGDKQSIRPDVTLFYSEDMLNDTIAAQ